MIKEIAKIDIATAQKIESNKPTPTLGGSKGDDGDALAKKMWSAEEKKRSMIRDGREKWLKKLEEDAQKELDLQKDLAEGQKNIQDNILRQRLEYFSKLVGLTTETESSKREDKVYKDLGISTPLEIKEAWDKRISAMMEGQAKEVEKRKKAQEETWMDAVEFSNKINNQMTDMLAESGAEIVEGLLSGGDGLQNAFKNILNAFGNFAIQTGKSLLPMLKLLDTLKKKPGVGTAIALIAGGAIEMVLPFEKTGQFANMIAQQMGGGGGNFSVATKISGNDLLILVERAKKTK